MKQLLILLILLPLLSISQGKYTPSKAELSKTYTQAITDYIKAVKSKHNISYDTLWFGKNADEQNIFPDIVLPESIEGTHIRVISAELGAKKQKEIKSRVYINLIAWVEKEKAEFIFVNFTNGFEHQYDCTINYKRAAKTNTFSQESLRFAYFAYQAPISTNTN